MEQIANQVIFGLLALVIVVCSILTVTTRRILRAATYLLFVLFATAGIYFQLDHIILFKATYNPIILSDNPKNIA